MNNQQPLPGSAVRTDVWDERQRTLGLCLVLAAITFAVFGQTLHHQFVNYDDNKYVYDNPMVARGLTLNGAAWAFSFHAHNWHPLTWLSHMLDCQLYGLQPGGHHLTNVLLHTGTVIALFLVLRQMTGALWRSAFVAAVFAIHPLRVESVAWVAERKDVLSGLFFVLTIGAYVRYARRPGSWERYGLVVFLFILGLMSKPMLVTLPLVLLLLDYWPLQRKEAAGKLLLEKLPFLVLSAAACVVTFLAQKGAIQSSETFSLPLREGNALVSGKLYLDEMAYPAGLALFYPFPNVQLVSKVALAGMILAGFSVVVWRERRKQPWLLMGWLWYLVMLLPVVGIIQVGRQAHADRYTYLPQIGIYVAVTWLVAGWVGQRLAASLMVVVIAVLMFCAWKQTAYWRDSETLWLRTLACTANNDLAHYALGNDLYERGKLDEAITQYQAALQIRPHYADAENNLGLVLYAKGNVDEAIAHYQTALQIRPRYAEAHNNLGVALLQKGNVDEAMAHYQAALQIRPDYVEARNNLDAALLKAGKADDAIAHYQEVLKINPSYANAHYDLGNVLDQKGRTDEAIAQYRQALQINPAYAEARNSLGRALCIKGNMEEGIAQFQQALQINPTNAEAHSNLGNALLQKGQANEAIAQFQQALRINPNLVEACNNLGNALLQQGKVDEAIACYKKALAIHPGYAPARVNLQNAVLQKQK